MTLFLRYYVLRACKVATGQPLTVCAACQRERQEKPTADQSHGVCPRHLRALMAQLRADPQPTTAPARKSLLDFAATAAKRLVESVAPRATKQHANDSGPNSSESPKPQGLTGRRVLPGCGDGRQSATSLTYTVQHSPAGTPSKDRCYGDRVNCARGESLAVGVANCQDDDIGRVVFVEVGPLPKLHVESAGVL